jgi:hypothetical protein
VGGGNLNNANGGFSVTCGGQANTNGANLALIGGGRSNTITVAAANAVLGGGLVNRVGGENGFLGGGAFNAAGGWGSTVVGGFDNRATASYATVPGGAKARALHVGAFVWSGVDAVTTESTNANSFTVRSPGGARFITATNNALAGAILLPNQTQWTILSSRESKTDFRPIKPREVLSKLAAMPVTSWQYRHDPSRRYIGPTSQDFMEAFHLGDYDKGINALDADGVTFAAIQGLVEELKERDAKHAKDLSARDQTIEELKAEMRALREEVRATLPPSGP